MHPQRLHPHISLYILQNYIKKAKTKTYFSIKKTVFRNWPRKNPICTPHAQNRNNLLIIRHFQINLPCFPGIRRTPAKNSQYFRKNYPYFRKNCQYFCFFYPYFCSGGNPAARHSGKPGRKRSRLTKKQPGLFSLSPAARESICPPINGTKRT